MQRQGQGEICDSKSSQSYIGRLCLKTNKTKNSNVVLWEKNMGQSYKLLETKEKDEIMKNQESIIPNLTYSNKIKFLREYIR